MPRYLILAQSEVTANALGALLELLGEKGREEGSKGDDPSRIVWGHPVGRGAAVDAYEALAQRVESAARAGEDRVQLNQVVVLVDSIRPAGLNAVDEGGSWDSLIAMLILTFPEVRWVFGVMQGECDEPRWGRAIEPHHSLSSLFNPARRDPLFDPTGLREWVRSCTNDGIQKAGDDLELPARQNNAAAIDEERPYAYLHGYTTYRFGCRADVVMTWTLMKERFQCTDNKQPPAQDGGKSGHEYWLLLEDMSLNFPDRPGGVHLHCLKTERKDHCKWLDSSNSTKEGSTHRILVTTGQTRPNDPALIDNRRYLREKKNHTGCGHIVFKPACGMFDLWEKAGLLRRWKGSRRRGDVEGFVWPALPPQRVDQRHCEERRGTDAKGHGSPGKLILVSEALVRRAEALLGKVECVGEAVQGAVLATDALELTGGRTPTTAIEALSLKHRFEILAECQFSGVEYHIKIKPRLNEIILETDCICRWFYRTERGSAKLNAQMHILNQLVRILREHNQFDEEQICLHRVRQLHATLWMRARPLRYVFYPFIRYLEWLLKSFLGFVGMVLVWLLCLSLLFALVLPPEAATEGSARLVIGMENAVTSFFSVGPPMQHGKPTEGFTGWQVLVSSLAMMSGFLHLGVLISHLYTLVSRR